ncbi:hypothetical protein GJAV_G00152690 [Gymnothorax javanicus]|nr:hypothetical protein GJAV_G00152690 [Gymnothorax javanicus]
MATLLRLSVVAGGRELCKRCISSLTGEGALPANLRIPSNLIELPRTKRSLTPDCELPVLRRCQTAVPAHLTARRTWLESFRSREDDQLGLVELHPDVFAVPPRVDILHQVEVWQRNFKRISHAKVKTRAEVRGGGRKPWKQKGSGRARHGSIRSPLWRGGGVSHGPRGPTSYYYMLPMKLRVLGLKVALSSKLAQDDLHKLGKSILIVDVNELPENMTQATASLKTVNVIPAIGLNVHSMLKHETLVLTLEAVNFLEKKLLWHDTRFTPLYPFKLPYSDFP